ncbi:sensor histidine kinase [Flavisolibacter tropicus]|uniref:sensor histidine kinase n=1 Tax=Flavisolibacter tropicus TaxID=1492898 RepID=UPI0008324515|nr:histidine kinase [Flavisolibacter tropicus]
MSSTIKDTWLRITCPFILISLSLVSQQLLALNVDKAIIAARLIFFIVLNFELARVIILLVRSRFPGLALTKRRIVTSSILSVLLTFVVISLSTWVSRLYGDKPVSFFDETVLNFLQSFWIGALIVAPYEVLYFYYLLLRSEKEKEQLQKATIESRLHSLQAQINPHFLFNSLNTLAALTVKDPYKAEAFTIEMSAVYRYLLLNNTQRLTTVKNELDFIHSFLHLLKTRFDEGFTYCVDVDPAFHAYLMPPLTLQILVENAVKHNNFSDYAPLHLHISVDDDQQLVVTNTLQKKAQTGPASGYGLSNIISRYNLLQQREVMVIESANEFKVVLPLISSVYEGAYC